MIQTAPSLEDGTPFPTLWWLTCRSLAKAVGRLESGGWMAAFNQRLAADPDLGRQLAASTAAYVARRDALAGPAGRQGGPQHPGGGGPGSRIKCLHAHTGHHLVTGDNPAGAAVLAELAWTDPTTPCA